MSLLKLCLIGSLPFIQSVLARTAVLNFEDLDISNEVSCAGYNPGGNQFYYQDYAIWGPGDNRIYNTTATRACASAKDFGGNDGRDPLGHAISQPNVLFSSIGYVNIQLQNATHYLVNNASFDAYVQFEEDELQAPNVHVSIGAMATDFGVTNIESGGSFYTATDGFGPYHIELDSTQGAPYYLLSFSAGIVFLDDEGRDDNSKFRHPILFLDNLTVNIEDSPRPSDA